MPLVEQRRINQTGEVPSEREGDAGGKLINGIVPQFSRSNRIFWKVRGVVLLVLARGVYKPIQLGEVFVGER